MFSASSIKVGVKELIGSWCATSLLIIVVFLTSPRGPYGQTKPLGTEPLPEPAIPAILATFDKYEVVAMPEAHGQKDVDDFIFSLIRNPTFPEKVNDIEVECGNSLYQPILDRYIAGENVPFKEVQEVWRNTTQPMCGMSGFFEQFFPLVRAVNQTLPPGKHLRVLAGDPPIDWEQVRSAQDVMKFGNRDATTASVMEKEVLAKGRKALMLFGTFHLLHGSSRSAVSIYEKRYPNVTFVVCLLNGFDMNLPTSWPFPSLIIAKGTWLGSLDLTHIFPPPISIDQDCRVHGEFPKDVQKPMADLVDAFLYLNPQGLALKEQFPADIVLDTEYRAELKRREALQGLVGSTDQQIVNGAESSLLVFPKAEDMKTLMQDPQIQKGVQSCLANKSHSSTPQ